MPNDRVRLPEKDDDDVSNEEMDEDVSKIKKKFIKVNL